MSRQALEAPGLLFSGHWDFSLRVKLTLYIVHLLVICCKYV